MASTGTTSALAPAVDPDAREQWELEQAIRRLRALEKKVVTLRAAIPQMLAPLNNVRRLPKLQAALHPSPPPTPPSSASPSPAAPAPTAISPRQAELIFSAFQATVAKTHGQLAAFRTMWNEDRTTQAMRRAAASYRVDDKDINTWCGPTEDEWINATGGVDGGGDGPPDGEDVRMGST